MTEQYGTVYLIGGGPGDPDLLTVKSDRLIRNADVLLHDALVGDEIIEAVPGPETEVIDVGKRADDDRRWRQEEINQCIVEKARQESTVVRLKGGDPTVFGRGGEEAEYLAERGVPFEFVPGITSPIAAPELAGIPLTHRDHASSLTVVTGHEAPTKDESALDWDALADNIVAGGTLVILMGVSRMEENLAMLQKNGVAADTPAAVVENAASSDGSTTLGTVETIPARSRQAGVEPPAVVIIGDVVGVRDDIEHALLEPLPCLSTQRDVSNDLAEISPVEQSERSFEVAESDESGPIGTASLTTAFPPDTPEP